MASHQPHTKPKFFSDPFGLSDALGLGKFDVPEFGLDEAVEAWSKPLDGTDQSYRLPGGKAVLDMSTKELIEHGPDPKIETGLWHGPMAVSKSQIAVSKRDRLRRIFRTLRGKCSKFAENFGPDPSVSYTYHCSTLPVPKLHERHPRLT